MDDEIEQALDDITEEAIEATEEEVESPKQETPAPKPKETPEAKKARLLRELDRVTRQLGESEEAPAPSKPHTGKLDDTQLDYLDLKGITDQDEIDVIEKVMAKTGQTVRQTLQDDYVKSKLDAIRAEKAVADATPGASRRSGGGSPNELASALARYEATQELPADFELRTKVVNAFVAKGNTNKPSWH